MIVVGDAVTEAEAAAVRASGGAYARYRRIDQASYEAAEGVPVPEGIVRIAREVTGRDLRVVDGRLLRFVCGDYTLAHHGYVEDHAVELVLDVSLAGVPGAEVHYRRRGRVVFAMPSQPRALAVVERGPTITANHTYLSKRLREAEVIRLVARLRDIVG
ncbi:MAG: hypothetical protein KIT31_08365 [Deltaproteobacteria bacterium]|nr:hypothetical protein [Deltaproteobacteria bacterium]